MSPASVKGHLTCFKQAKKLKNPCGLSGFQAEILTKSSLFKEIRPGGPSLKAGQSLNSRLSLIHSATSTFLP